MKKIHTRNLITKKISADRKSPPPPLHNFSNGPSLNLMLMVVYHLQKVPGNAVEKEVEHDFSGLSS